MDYTKIDEDYARQDAEKRCKIMAPKLTALCVCTIVGFVLTILSFFVGIICGILRTDTTGPVIVMVALIVVNALVFGINIILMRDADDRFQTAGIFYIIYYILSNAMDLIFDQNIVGSTFNIIGAILGLIYITNFTSAMSDSLWHINNALADNWMTFKKVFFGLLIATLACVVLAFIPIINILAAIALVIIAIGLIGVGIWQLVLLFMSAGAVRNYLK